MTVTSDILKSLSRGNDGQMESIGEVGGGMGSLEAGLIGRK